MALRPLLDVMYVHEVAFALIAGEGAFADCAVDRSSATWGYFSSTGVVAVFPVCCVAHSSFSSMLQAKTSMAFLSLS